MRSCLSLSLRLFDHIALDSIIAVIHIHCCCKFWCSYQNAAFKGILLLGVTCGKCLKKSLMLDQEMFSKGYFGNLSLETNSKPWSPQVECTSYKSLSMRQNFVVNLWPVLIRFNYTLTLHLSLKILSTYRIKNIGKTVLSYARINIQSQ